MRPPIPFLIQIFCPLPQPRTQTRNDRPVFVNIARLLRRICISNFSPTILDPQFVPLLCPITLVLHAVGSLRRSRMSFFLYQLVDF